MKIFKLFITPILFIFLSGVIYYRLVNVFYQQDEWQALGHFLANGHYTIFSNLSFPQLIFGEGRILTSALFYLFFVFSPYNTIFLSLVAIVLQGINTFFIYLISQKIFKYSLTSFTLSIIFLTNSVFDQSIIWFGGSLATLLAGLFILLSLYFYLSYLNEKRNSKFVLAFICLFISIYFKEVGVPLLILYPLLYILEKKREYKEFLKVSILPVLYFILFGLVRVGEIIYSSHKVGDYVSKSTPIKHTLLINVLLYPLTGFSQSLIPDVFMYTKAKEFFVNYYNTFLHTLNPDLIAQTVVTDFITALLSLGIIGLLLVISVKLKKLKVFLFSILFYFFSMLPYIFILRGSSYLESRYYYIPFIGVLFCLGILIDWLLQNKNKLITVISLILIGVYSLWNTGFISNELKVQIDLASQRKTILYSVKKTIPVIKPQTVIYVESDYSYIVGNNPLPFQEGIGYTFLVWLSDKKHLYFQDLLNQNYLWDIGSEGFARDDKYGYGFFTNYSDLKDSVKKNNIQIDNVYAFYWDSKKKSLLNITDKIRSSLYE